MSVLQASGSAYARLPPPPTCDLFCRTRVKSRMKRSPSRLSHRDRGDGRRGEAKEAGGRQSKGRKDSWFVWLLAQLSATAINTAKRSFNLLEPHPPLLTPPARSQVVFPPPATNSEAPLPRLASCHTRWARVLIWQLGSWGAAGSLAGANSSIAAASYTPLSCLDTRRCLTGSHFSLMLSPP